MAPKKITALEYSRLKGHTQKNIAFVISKLYKKDETKTPNQWRDQMVKDKVIDKKSK